MFFLNWESNFTVDDRGKIILQMHKKEINQINAFSFSALLFD